MVMLALFLLFVGCGEGPITQRARLFRESFQRQVSVTELELWARGCLAKGVITEEGAPEAVRKLMRDADVSVLGDGDKQVVCFIYGSGFGHWGLAIGDSTYQCKLGDVQNHWTNGIWFWHQ